MKSFTLITAMLLAGTVQAGEIVIHKQPNFTGGALTLRDDKASLASSGFQDQASSIEVKSGRWQVCSQPEYNGDCVTLDRGNYATLDQKINHRIESVRELPVVVENTYGRKSYQAERYAREREREERLAREREREREDRYVNRYDDRYADRYSDRYDYDEDRAPYRGNRW